MHDDLATVFPIEQTALVIAHPGHELRVWYWLEQVRPLTSIVTDGSGQTGRSRASFSRGLLQEAGARASSFFGVASDRTIYAAVLAGNHDFFRSLIDDIASELIRQRIRCVVGDAAEGRIMAHDLLREVRREAVRRAEQSLDWQITQYEYALDSHPASHPPLAAHQIQKLNLSESDLARKLSIARGYQAIESIVDADIGTYGERAFSVECMFACTDASLLTRLDDGKLPYELHGEEQVRLGRYPTVIRYRDHLVPILKRLTPERYAA